METKTLKLSGFIEVGDYPYHKIKLIQPDGYKIDLISRFAEFQETFEPKQVGLRYFISYSKATEDQMTEALIMKLSGALTAEYEANGYAYSEWTTGTDYDSNLTVGKHDLYKELQAKRGKYLSIEISAK